LFNSDYKKESLANLKVVANEYQIKYKSTINSVMDLHALRLKSVELIKSVESYIYSIENVPNELQTILKATNTNYTNFEREIKNIELENKKIKDINQSSIGAGVLAGTGVALGAGIATFGPGAAMAIATTFGTASTGVAISTLTGAAATSSALAWLGGGAIAAGGGGMAAGTTLLGAFGPIGWAIGGVALAGGGLWANSKNKKVAREAEENTFKIKEEIKKLSNIKYNVNSVKIDMTNIEDSIKLVFYKMSGYGISNYNDFNDEQISEINKLASNTFKLSNSICKKID
jgi:hypothetical protein